MVRVARDKGDSDEGNNKSRRNSRGGKGFPKNRNNTRNDRDDNRNQRSESRDNNRSGQRSFGRDSRDGYRQTDRKERDDRTARPARGERSDRQDRTERSERPERRDRFGGADRDRRSNRTERPQQRNTRRWNSEERTPQSNEGRTRRFEQRPNRPAEGSGPFKRRQGPEKMSFREQEARRDFLVWGRHPVTTFLTNLSKRETFDKKQHVLHVIVDKTGAVPAQLVDAVRDAELLGLRVQKHRSEDDAWPLGSFDDLTHQRICLKIPEYPLSDMGKAKKITSQAKEGKHKGCIGIVLDQIQDPRNFGAILRSAAFFGARYVIFGKNRQAEVTPLVLKTSAGGAFELELVPVVNIARAIEELKECGAWIVGTSVENATTLKTIPIDRPFLLVLGNEQKGQRPEVSKHCDYLVNIPGGTDNVDSLNVSVAAGVMLSHFTSNKGNV